MASLDAEIDALYRGPAAAFVSERDAIARRHPQAASTVRALRKPTTAAWAVNQLYWTRRQTIDRLVRAAERVRDLQVRRLGGKAADVPQAEGARRTALDRAMTDAADLLTRAGEPATSATLTAIRETLETLPWAHLDGRLVRPLKPTGLEGFAALATAAPIRTRPPADIVPLNRSTPPAAARDVPMREARAERQRVIATLERERREAEQAERRARDVLERARAATAKADAHAASVEAALEQARDARDARRRALRDAEQQVEHASRTRQTALARLEAARAAGDD